MTQDGAQLLGGREQTPWLTKWMVPLLLCKCPVCLQLIHILDLVGYSVATLCSSPSSSGVALVKYVVRECHDFFSHLLATVNEASEKGDIPHPTFRQVVVDANGTHLTVDEAADGTKKILKKDRVKRKPNAFNIFVKKVSWFIIWGLLQFALELAGFTFTKPAVLLSQKCDQIRASGTDSNNAGEGVHTTSALIGRSSLF